MLQSKVFLSTIFLLPHADLQLCSEKLRADQPCWERENSAIVKDEAKKQQEKTGR